MPCVNHPEVLDPLIRCTRCQQEFCTNCLVELKGGRFCGRCKAEEVKDVQSGVDSSELPWARVSARIAAQMVDGLILAALWVPAAIALGFFRIDGPGAGSPAIAAQIGLQLGLMVIFLLYEAVLLQWRGQTFGKMAVRIKVVTPEGLDISAGQAWIRAFVRLLLSCFWIVDYVPAFFTKQKTTIHDMAARTRVVRLGS